MTDDERTTGDGPVTRAQGITESATGEPRDTWRTHIDMRYGPAVALVCSVLAAILVTVSHSGWHVLWPALGALFCVGLTLLVMAFRRSATPSLWIVAPGAGLVLSSLTAALWGIVNGTAL